MGSPFDLAGHVTVVTGGNGGIGFGMARGLAAAGANVVIWGRNTEKNAKAVAALDGHGTGEIRAFRCDVSDPAQVHETMAATLQAFGRVDSCFANAGVFANRVGFLNIDLDEWRRVLAVDLDGVFLTLQSAIGHMVERGGGGSLVVTSSIASLYGQPRSEHYGAAKAGADAVVRGLASEFGEHGIRANAILPGWIVVDATRDAYEQPAFKAKVQRRVPLRRWGTPDDLAATAVFLATPANGYLTGQTIVIDGGYTIF